MLHKSQVGLIYSVTPCLVGRVRKDSVLGSAGKTKPAALSPLSLSVSINQLLSPAPPSHTHTLVPLNPSVSSLLFPFSDELPMKYKNAHYKYSSSRYVQLCVYTHKRTVIHRSQDMGKWLGEALKGGGGPYVQTLYISRLTPSALPDHHNLVCLQHKVWSKLGWVH